MWMGLGGARKTGSCWAELSEDLYGLWKIPSYFGLSPSSALSRVKALLTHPSLGDGRVGIASSPPLKPWVLLPWLGTPQNLGMLTGEGRAKPAAHLGPPALEMQPLTRTPFPCLLFHCWTCYLFHQFVLLAAGARQVT